MKSKCYYKPIKRCKPERGKCEWIFVVADLWGKSCLVLFCVEVYEVGTWDLGLGT